MQTVCECECPKAEQASWDFLKKETDEQRPDEMRQKSPTWDGEGKNILEREEEANGGR